jgi:hypothetical protein
MTNFSRPMLAGILGLLMSLAARPASSFDGVEGGNDIYRIVINDAPPTVTRSLEDGFYTAFTGPAHPVTAWAARPAELLSVRRDCVTCGGDTNLTFAVVRSYGSATDYTLGEGLDTGFFIESEPGFTCLNATRLFSPMVEQVLDGGLAVGARATWSIVNGEDDLLIEATLRVHGEDLVGSSVEVTVRVQNRSDRQALLGVRNVWALRISSAVTPSNPTGSFTAGDFHVGTRPPDPPVEPFTLTETEWYRPAFRAWQAHAGSPFPTTSPIRYSVMGAIAGPSTLDPPPTPPHFLQQGAMDIVLGSELPGGGSANRCFDWRIPDPPRVVRDVEQMTMTTYWGLDPADALVVPPGGEVSVTQYLVAFFEYPLSARTDGPFVAACNGGTTAVPISGAAETIEPTVAEIHRRWSSTDPRVTFTDATDPLTQALVEGIGTFPVTLTVSVGAYEAAATTEVTIVDAEPPRFTSLVADPAALWPPNHRLVEVCVTPEVADTCDPEPTLRLVSVRSSEPPDAPGDGDTEVDIRGAAVGEDDRCVLLRAERDGRGRGRTYTLVYEAEDWAGNVARQAVEVVVPHDQREHPTLPPRGGAARPLRR